MMQQRIHNIQLISNHEDVLSYVYLFDRRTSIQLFFFKDLELDHIHGYRGFDCRDNLFYLADNESIVYPAAGAGVIHNIAQGTQKFYLKHTDDIISMAVHNGERHGNIVASGQIGENPTIHIWNVKERQTISVLSGKHNRGENLVELSSFESRSFVRFQVLVHSVFLPVDDC